MAGQKKVPCLDCGGPAWWNPRTSARAVDQVRCRSCYFKARREYQTTRLEAQPHGSNRYQAGCRCDICRTANTVKCRKIRQSAPGTPRGAATSVCEMCSRPFEPGHTSTRLCSEACAQERRRIREHSRRAITNGAASVTPVIPREIYDRDQWRCHICRRKLSADTVWPHPRFASIDHLVPLSKGGEHTPENVATACLQCNISKGNRGGNEQLLLIG